MPAAYDSYDYPSYWKGRGYEHQAELHAIRKLLSKVPKADRILEIGAGFGRLYSVYEHKGKKVILSDPSAKMLKVARARCNSKKVSFIQCSLENLERKIKPKTIDLVILVRVLHHIENPERTFEIVSHLLKPNGYFILEYANKTHFKASIKELLKGNLMYTHDIFPKELNKKKTKKCLPLYNFHPHLVSEYLKRANFVLLEKRSVSNVRNTFFKRIIPISFLLFLEKALQRVMGKIDFGPSIFVLARRKKVILDYLKTS